MMIKTYKQLSRILTFEDRFEYLKLNGAVGLATFGYDRHMNQLLYHSSKWQKIRDLIIIRDDACDLGVLGRDIYDGVIVHHINPITIADIENDNPIVYDRENLICTCLRTHNAIHYGDASLLATIPKDRKKGDTTLWTAY